MNVSPFELGGIISILSYSFFASLHCAFMCGPMVCSVLGPKNHYKHLDLWLYNLARISMYTVLGAILGILGSQLTILSPMAGAYAAWAIGIGLIAAAVLSILKLMGATLVSTPDWLKLSPVKAISAAIKRTPKQLHPILLGYGTAFLPCMTLTPAFAMAMNGGSGLGGAMLMAAFGLGTLPIMFFSPAITRKVIEKLPRRGAQVVAALFLIVAGVVTIMRIGH